MMWISGRGTPPSVEAEGDRFCWSSFFRHSRHASTQKNTTFRSYVNYQSFVICRPLALIMLPGLPSLSGAKMCALSALSALVFF